MSSGRRRAARVQLGLAVLAALVVSGSCTRGGSSTGSVKDGFGFGTVRFTIRSGSETGRWCALLADTRAERSRGLMERRDLGPYAGMVFRFDEDTQVRFFMKDTPMPLSIAWFDAQGRFVSSADMTPCPEGQDCRRYAAVAPYRYALEVPQGDLERLGIGEGSVLELGGSCPGGATS